MTEDEDFKQMKIRAPRELYEQFHRVFPGRGEKQSFFLRMMELAAEKGSNWSLAKQVEQEVKERYGKA